MRNSTIFSTITQTSKYLITLLEKKMPQKKCLQRFATYLAVGHRGHVKSKRATSQKSHIWDEGETRATLKILRDMNIMKTVGHVFVGR